MLNSSSFSVHSSSFLFCSSIAQNHFLRPLITSRLVTARGLAPGRYWISTARSLALTTTMRMVYRVHRHAANMRPDSFPARATGLTVRNIFVLDVADLSDRRLANQRYASHFAGGHTQLGVTAFLCHELSKCAGGTSHLTTLARPQLDVVHLRRGVYCMKSPKRW